jgi:hypothetical protein
MASGAGRSQTTVHECQVDAVPSDCSGPERWVWAEVFKGREADLVRYTEDTTASGSDATRRILRPQFIRALIVRGNSDPIVSARGIAIINADVCDGGDCQSRIPDGVFLRRQDGAGICPPTVCAAPLDLRDLRVRGGLALRNSFFHTDVRLGGAYFEQVLNLDQSHFYGDVDAYRLRVDGGLTLFNAFVDESFEADGLRTGGTANFYLMTVRDSIHLRNANIGNDLDFGRMTVFGPLRDIPRKELRSSVELPRSAIDLSNAKIAGQFYASGARAAKGNVDLSGLAVAGSIWMEGAQTEFSCPLTLERAHIGNDLMLGAGTFYQVDLTGAVIEGTLRLESGRKGTNWKPANEMSQPDCNQHSGPVDADAVAYRFKTWMTLRNAKIHAIRDTRTAWPDCITLAGLTYGRPPQNLAGRYVEDDPGRENRSCEAASPGTALGRTNPDESKQPRDADWWLSWLGRDPQLVSEDYAQLAAALDGIGNHDQADDVRFAMRSFETRQSTDLVRRSANWVAGTVVGFGIGSYTGRAALSAGLLLLLGVFLLRHRLCQLEKDVPSAPLKDKNVVWCTIATVQTILPLITLSKAMDDFLHAPADPGNPKTAPLNGWYAIGFASLAFFGFVLSGFLLQALRSSFGL